MNMDNINELTEKEEKSISGGAVIAIGTVAAVLAIGILAIVVWKIYTSSKGEVTLPGGFKFEWATAVLKGLFGKK